MFTECRNLIHKLEPLRLRRSSDRLRRHLDVDQGDVFGDELPAEVVQVVRIRTVVDKVFVNKSNLLFSNDFPAQIAEDQIRKFIVEPFVSAESVFRLNNLI